MIHWPDPPFLIAGTLCGFDRDPMRERATIVAQVAIFRTIDYGATWTIGAGWRPTSSLEAAQRAAEAAIGGEA